MNLDMFSLKGRIGIVTGGGTGLGKGIATALVQAGAELVIAGRRKDILEKAAEEMSQNEGKVIPVKADISKLDDIKRLVERTIDKFGKIDFLFNNAGTVRRTPCEDHSEADWDSVIETNLKGPFFLGQAVAKRMIAGKRRGKIINTASLISVIGAKNAVSYGASKGGIAILTKSMANDLAKYNILVNAIAPGWFITDLTQEIREDSKRFPAILSRIPLGRWGNPQELGGVAVFLASDASNYMTGQVIYVDGGYISS